MDWSVDWILNLANNTLDSIPEDYKLLISIFFYTLFIAVYAIFIWRFYKFLASREIITLNLNQYNYSKHPSLEKFLAVVLYTVEYLVILPFLVLFWFTILSLFLLLLSESESVQQILLISASIIASTRITAYISEDLSKDLAKVLPFTVLAMFILNEDSLSVGNLISRINEIPFLFNNIIIFIIFIFGIEFLLRGFYSIGEFFRSEEQINEN
jgi:hypothetical protein